MGNERGFETHGMSRKLLSINLITPRYFCQKFIVQSINFFFFFFNEILDERIRNFLILNIQIFAIKVVVKKQSEYKCRNLTICVEIKNGRENCITPRSLIPTRVIKKKVYKIT